MPANPIRSGSTLNMILHVDIAWVSTVGFLVSLNIICSIISIQNKNFHLRTQQSRRSQISCSWGGDRHKSDYTITSYIVVREKSVERRIDGIVYLTWKASIKLLWKSSNTNMTSWVDWSVIKWEGFVLEDTSTIAKKEESSLPEFQDKLMGLSIILAMVQKLLKIVGTKLICPIALRVWW